MTLSPAIDQRNSCGLRSVGIYPLYCICTCCKRTKWRIISSCRKCMMNRRAVTREKAISLSVRSRASSEKRVDMGMGCHRTSRCIVACPLYILEATGAVVNFEISRPGNQSDIHILGGTPQLAPSSKATAIHACLQSSIESRPLSSSKLPNLHHTVDPFEGQFSSLASFHIKLWELVADWL